MAITAGGRCHAILARLAEGPASPVELVQVIRRPGQSRRLARSNFWSRADGLQRSGLIVKSFVGFRLTDEGHALAEYLGPFAPRATAAVEQRRAA